MHVNYLVLHRSMCRGHANWPRTGKLAPRLRPRKTGDTSFTSPVMCLGLIFLSDIVASDAHNMHTKCGLLLQNVRNQYIRKNVPNKLAPTFSRVLCGKE